MLYIAFVCIFFVNFLFTYNKNHLSKKNWLFQPDDSMLTSDIWDAKWCKSLTKVSEYFARFGMCVYSSKTSRL